MTRSYYASILEISPDADEAEIKAAYRRMAKKLHPDVNHEPGALERFQELKKAYDFLLAPQTQPRYFAVHPAQKREEEEKKKREFRMKRAREMRKKKEEEERLAWEKFKRSPAMWLLIFAVLTLYFVIVGVCIRNITEYPYPKSRVQDPEVAVAGSLFVIAGFTVVLYRFYQFIRKP